MKSFSSQNNIEKLVLNLSTRVCKDRKDFFCIDCLMEIFLQNTRQEIKMSTRTERIACFASFYKMNGVLPYKYNLAVSSENGFSSGERIDRA